MSRRPAPAPRRAVSRVVAPARSRLTIAGWQLGWRAVRRLPERAAYRAFEVIADAQTRANGKGVQRLRANYAKVRPELTPEQLEQLVRAGVRSYLRYFCEAFRLPDRTPEELARAVRAIGDEPIRRRLDAGGSVVIFLAHLGNWDVAGAWSTGHLAAVTTIAERLEPEQVFREFLAFREGLGITILPLTGGPDPFTGLKAAVARGDFVCLLADRDLTRGGVEVDFCGHRARMAKGPAALAVVTDTPLYAAAIYYAPAAPGRGLGGYETVVDFSAQIPVPAGQDLPDQVAAMTQACASYLQEAVTRHTEDWHMMQRVFVEDLDPARTPKD